MQEDGRQNDHQLTLEELAARVDLPVRTIRYYIAEGLVPGPGGRGKAASYGEEHLLKLRLIRRLSEQRMPLAEMQALLPRLALSEVQALLEEQEQRADELARAVQETTAKGYIEKLLQNAQAARQASVPDVTQVKKKVPPVSGAVPTPPLGVPSGPLPTPTQPYSSSSWRHWELAPGVELHVRSDAEYQQRNLLERIFRAAGMIFRQALNK